MRPLLLRLLITRSLAACCLLSGGAAAGPEIALLPAKPIARETTVLWSPLMKATWEELQKETGKYLGTEPPNTAIKELEAFQWDRDQTLPPGSWKTWSGPATRQFLDRANAEARQITGEQEDLFELLAFDPSEKAAFGLFDHQIEFRRELYRSKKVPLIFKANGTEQEVAFFGSVGAHSAISPLLWDPENRSQALQIDSKDPDDSLILYLPPEPVDIQSASIRIRDLLQASKSGQASTFVHSLADRDEVRIPYLDIDARKNLTADFEGVSRFERASLTNPGVTQAIRFKLHEKGASVRVVGAVDPFGSAPEPRKPRHFIYDQPFFVFMWRKDAGWPYFAAWISGSDGLEPFKPAAGE